MTSLQSGHGVSFLRNPGDSVKVQGPFYPGGEQSGKDNTKDLMWEINLASHSGDKNMNLVDFSANPL